MDSDRLAVEIKVKIEVDGSHRLGLVIDVNGGQGGIRGVGSRRCGAQVNAIAASHAACWKKLFLTKVSMFAPS